MLNQCLPLIFLSLIHLFLLSLRLYANKLCHTNTSLCLYNHTGDKPKLQELQVLGSESGAKKIRVIDTVAAQWEELAIALGFEAAVINYIRRDHVHDAKGACCHVLTKWLAEKEENLRSPVTWTTLIECLTDAGFAGLAEDLKKVKIS